MSRLPFLSFTLILLASWGRPAEAGSITDVFTGTVTDPSGVAGATVGEPFTGSFTYDPDDLSPVQSSFSTSSPWFDLEIHLGPNVFTTAESSLRQILGPAPTGSGGTDFTAYVQNLPFVSGVTRTLGLELYAPPGAPYPYTSPPSPLDFSRFAWGRIYITPPLYAGSSETFPDLVGSITSFQQQVPEPSSLTSIVTGLTGLALLLRRRRRLA
jgi:hypothetical protein